MSGVCTPISLSLFIKSAFVATKKTSMHTECSVLCVCSITA